MLILIDLFDFLKGGTSRAQWEDVTGSTPLTFVNDCVSFTTTVSARFWLMDCRNIGDATRMATELYRLVCLLKKRQKSYDKIGTAYQPTTWC